MKVMRAIVTGGATNIERAITEALLARGGRAAWDCPIRPWLGRWSASMATASSSCGSMSATRHNAGGLSMTRHGRSAASTCW